MISCGKCQAENSPTEDVCSQCGASLLPGRSVGSRLGSVGGGNQGDTSKKGGTGIIPRYVEAKVEKHTVVQCEHCGRQYNDTYVGKAASDVGLLEFSSRKAAGRAAQAATQDESGNSYRCPGCGRYQSWMLQHAKSSAAAKGCRGAAWAL